MKKTFFKKEDGQKKRILIADRQAGFTLIEIIVSLGIFTVVAVVAMGAFLKVIDANKKSQSLKTAINNVNFALESISRELRVGSNYYCFNSSADLSSMSMLPTGYPTPGCVTTGVNGIAFLSSKTAVDGGGKSCALIHAYLFVTDPTTNVVTIKKAEQEQCGVSIASDKFQPIISPDAVITDYNMNIFPAASSNGPQPRAFIHIKGYAGIQEKNKTYFDVQTTVSQRNIF